MSRKTLFACLLVASLFLLGLAAPNLAPSVDWWVMGSGGETATSGSTSLSGTAGQTVVGPSSASSSALCAGFWCAPNFGPPTVHRNYLPMMRRNS